MSDTKIHKEKGKFKNGELDYKDTDESFKLQADRHNNKRGKFRHEKREHIEKVIDKIENSLED